MKRNLIIFCLLFSSILFCNPKIMLTGYWSPTGIMLEPFSDIPELNSGEWIGENWNDSGYDVYAYFPTPGSYTGLLEVDYQDTWQDFWAIADSLKPIAIISWGAGQGPWEIEYNARNCYNWVNDSSYPYDPTPTPPDTTVEGNFERNSTLPVDQIADNVNHDTDINAWVDYFGDPGQYLCEFLAYLGMMYHDIHQDDQIDYCKAAGFIHVNSSISVEDAREAAMITIQTTIDYLNDFTELNGNVFIADNFPQNTRINLFNDNRSYTALVDNENGDFIIPNVAPDDYKIAAAYEDYYICSQEISVDQTNSEVDLNLVPCELIETESHHNDFNTIVEVPNYKWFKAASKFTNDELAENIGNLIGKIKFQTPLSDSDCEIYAQIHSSPMNSTNPSELLYEKKIENFEANEFLEHIVEIPTAIEDGMNYFVGYKIKSNSGVVGCIDNGPVITGKGAFFWVWNNWYQLASYTGDDGNWMISMDLYQEPETDDDDEIVSIADLNLKTYPNPFVRNNDRVDIKISYILPENGEANLSIYNLKGQKVRNIFNEKQEKGYHEITWDGKNNSQNDVPTGIYFMKLKSESHSKVQKFMVLK